MFAGNIIAFFMTLVLDVFYLVNRRFVVTKTKYYSHSLLFLLLSSLLGITADALLLHLYHLSGLCIFVLSLYYICSLLAFSYACLYLVSRILVNSRTSNYLKQSNLVILFLVCTYVMLLLLNIPMGILFTLEDGVFTRGPLYGWDVVAYIVSLVLVLVCYFRKRRYVSRSLYLMLLQLLGVLALCITLSAILESTRLCSLMLALMHLMLYLNFRRVYIGEHALSTLSDRRGFIRDAEDFFRLARPITLFFVRLQNMDAMKAQYGSKAFYELLFRFADRLWGCVEYAHAYRVSDEGFMLITEPSKKQSKEQIVQAVSKASCQGVLIGDLEIKPDCILVEYTPNDAQSDAAAVYENALAAADYAAMCGERYISYLDTYLPAMRERAKKRDLVRYVDREHGYSVLLQPVKGAEHLSPELLRTQIKLAGDGEDLTSEALARVIEEAGKDHALTYFVLEEVCRAMAENPELSHMRALIDLPLSQLANGELLHRINEITARYRISHDNIIFRISEQITLPALEAQRDALRAICAMNYSFHIVNFGASGVGLQTMLALGARCVWLDDLLISSTDESALSHLIAWLRESGLFVALEEKASVYSDALLERFKPDYLCAASYAPPMNPEELLARLKAEK